MTRQHPELLYMSALLRSQDHTHPIKAGITKDHFDAYPDEWDWVDKFIRRHGKAPSKVSFRTKFPDAKIIAVDDIDHWADELHEASSRRAVVDMLTRSADLVMKGSLADAVSVLNAGAKRLSTAMSSSNIRETSVIEDFDHIFDVVAAKHERFKQRGKAGIPTGIPTIDIATGGAQPGELWVVAARLGAGKSFTLMRMAVEAIRTDNDALYNALEQSRAQVTLRVQNLLSGAIYRSTDLNRGDVKDMAKYREFLMDLKSQISGALVVSDHPRITPEYLAAQIERNKPSIVFVDYLTLMRTNRSGASKDWLNVGELSAELKALAEDYQIPIVTASQINRAGAGNQTPGTEHLSYADAVGQDADCVITMVRSSQHLLKGKVAKYRNGEDGQKFNLLFDPGRGVLEEVNDSKAKDIMEADDIANDAD
ncbi:DnaB Replicative DNA helicase [uncultured Caudovirales phage]|uniref:DnaB Replicative DNA helicase n=1 Tax=uncultured Caudovirales phage TaxID=2100421 RepID=A0A6J5RLU6_9CAUD|nr:DnaB Replicative DNA helicase [uncultured Caudovirales phage]